MYKEPNQLINRLVPLAIVAAVVGGSYLLFRDDIDQQTTKVTAIRAQAERTEQDRIQLDLARERAETLNPLLEQLNAAESKRAVNEEAIASERVRTNCIWVDSDGSNQKVLAGAQPVYPGTQVPLPAGVFACDRSGNTGKIGSDGRVDPASVARTRAAVPKEYHRSQWFQKQAGEGQ